VRRSIGALAAAAPAAGPSTVSAEHIGDDSTTAAAMNVQYNVFMVFSQVATGRLAIAIIAPDTQLTNIRFLLRSKIARRQDGDALA
jgi:hypothetical protein